MTAPKALGFSSSRLMRIDRFLEEQYIDSGKLPGAQLIIARRGQIVHETVLGLADRERGTRLESDAIFRIYSMTKPITSAAFMMLVEEGLVALDDPVDRYIPAWRDLGVFVSGTVGTFQSRRCSNPMRIVDLLRHTSGLTYDFHARTNVDAAYRKLDIGAIGGNVSLDAMIERLASVPLEFSPGEAWNYSISTDVLGYLVSKISGEPFADFLHGRIFAPLGMTDTDFFVPEAKSARFAACYAVNESGRVVLQDDPRTSRFLAEPVFVSGGGGLVGTAADYMKFCTMLLAGGCANGHRFLSRKTIELMTLNHLPGGRQLTEMSRGMFSEATYAGVGYGLGLGVTLDLAKTMIAASVGEYFWGGMASTAFWIDPLEDIAVVFMTQFMPSSYYPIRRQLRTLVYAALED